MPIRLAVIDGHTLTRYGLRELVAQHPDIQLVAECGSAADAQRVLEAARPDVVTVDVNLPDRDGLRLARELRDRYAGLGIVILASQGQDDVLFRALETGVSAFVGKTAPVEEMLGGDPARGRRGLLLHGIGAGGGARPAPDRAGSARAQPAGNTGAWPAGRRTVDSRDRGADVHQPVHGQDLRRTPVREAGCGEPGPGADDGHPLRPDPVLRHRLLRRGPLPWEPRHRDIPPPGGQRGSWADGRRVMPIPPRAPARQPRG